METIAYVGKEGERMLEKKDSLEGFFFSLYEIKASEFYVKVINYDILKCTMI